MLVAEIRDHGLRLRLVPRGEQARLLAIDAQLQFAEVARTAIVEPELAPQLRADVAEGIEDRVGVIPLHHMLGNARRQGAVHRDPVVLNRGRSFRPAARLRQPCVDLYIACGHDRRREPVVERLPAACPADVIDVRGDQLGQLADVLAHESVDAVSDELGQSPKRACDDGCSAGKRLDGGEAERLRPVDRQDMRDGAADECVLLLVANLADEVDIARLVEEWLDDLLEVLAVQWIDLRGHDQRQPGALRDLDGPVRALLERHPAKEQQVGAGRLVKPVHVRGKAVINRGGPVLIGQGPALVVADGNERRIGKLAEDLPDLRNVQPAVHGVDDRRHRRARPSEGEREVVEVGVDDVEVDGALPDAFHFLNEDRAHTVRMHPLGTQRPRPHRRQIRARV